MYVNYLQCQPATASITIISDNIQIITEKEKDILHYIAGSIVRKVENIVKKHKQANENHTQLLQSLKTDEVSEGCLTAIHDRGGLTHVKEEVKTLLVYIEQLYRSHVSSAQCSSASFIRDPGIPVRIPLT